MRNLFVALYLTFAITTGFGAEPPPEEELIVSTPEEIGSQSSSFLIKELISPLSGNLSLKQTDLIVRGAQEIRLERTYTSPHIPSSLHDKEKHKKNWDKYFLYQHLSKNYKGWEFFPHRRLQVYPKDKTIRVSDSNGMTLDFQFSETGITLVSDSYGMSNVAGEVPSGKNDPRNTKVSLEENNTKIIVKSPDGSSRIYRGGGIDYFTKIYICYLEKEILPNGKIIKYHFQNNQLHYIESLNPDESIVYASLRLKGHPWHGECTFFSSSHDTATYSYEKRLVELEIKEKTQERYFKEEVNNYLPPILKEVSSPFYRRENLKYSDNLSLEHFDGRTELFDCRYGVFSSHNRLEKLLLPVGPDGAFQEVCTIDYDPAVAGVKEGTTTVKNADGTKTVYRFTGNLLIKAVETYDEQGTLELQKHYSWTRNGWLKSISILNGKNSLFSTKFYEYDPFGNPIRETITGDLSGLGNSETYTIKRTFSQDGRNLLLKEENEEGKVTCFEYLPKTNLLTAKLTQDKDQILIREFYIYDKCNNLVQKIIDDGKSKDPSDLFAVTQRTFTNLILRQEAPFVHMPEWIEEKYLKNGEEKLTKRIHLTYDRRGNVCIEDIYDAEETFAYSIYKTYSERGDLLSETNALGQERTLRYDDKGKPIFSENFSGRLHKIKTYDLKGRLLKEKQLEVDGIKKEFSYAYDANDNLIKKLDEYENATHYIYDPITHKPIKCDFPKIPSTKEKPLSVTTHLAYDSLGREISKTDPNGNTTTYTYNARGNKTEILYPNGSKETLIYYKNGDLKKHTTQEGLTIAYKYDVLGRVNSKKYTSNELIAEESFTYNALHLLSETDMEGNSTKYSYDGLGRKIQENFCDHVIEYQYDALGRLHTKIKHNGDNTLLIHYERDLLDRMTSENKTDTLGNLLYKTSCSYDEDGNKKEITYYINNKPNAELFTYDPFGRIIEYKDPLGNATQTTYNNQHINHIGQKVLQKTTIDPKKTSLVKTYDSFGQVTKREILNPHGHTLAKKEFYFDPCSNLILEKDHIYKNTNYQNTQTISYRYNNSNLLESFTRAFGTNNERTTLYTYTPSGKTASKTFPNGSVLLHNYHPLGFRISLTSSDGTIGHKFERNLLGDLLSASDERSNIKTEREVDPFGNILKEAFSTGLSIEKSYDAFNRPLSVKITNQGEIEYSYNPLYMTSVARISPSGILQYLHTYKNYDYDGNLRQEELIGDRGSIIHQLDQKGQKTALMSPYLKQIITYDACDNLTSIDEDDARTDFTYDGLDQLILERSPNHNSEYTYDSNYNRVEKNNENIELNELDELQSLGSISCEYDLNGNLVTKKIPKETVHFTYDALNQLIGATSKNRQVRFIYDPLGRRLSKIVQESGTWEERYLWDRQNEIGAFNASNSPKNLKILGANSVIGIELESKPFAPIIDVQGNIRHLVDLSSKTETTSYNYTAFGEEINPSKSSLSNPWRYESKRWDQELDLSYFGKRYYDPQLARWLTTDPAGFVDGTDLYQYSFNNPLKFYDLDGSEAVTCSLVLWGVARSALTLGALSTPVGWAILGASILGTAAVYGGYKLVETCCQEGYVPSMLYDVPGSSLQQNIYKTETETEEEKKTGGDVYVPDRPLLQDKKSGEPASETDAPNTQLGTRESKTGKGKYPQAREFDKDGKPIKDIDFTDHRYPNKHPNPHEHEWKPNKTGGTSTRSTEPKPLPQWSYE